MKRLLQRVESRSKRRRWDEAPDHERSSVMCRLAWHRWAVSTVVALDLDDVDGGSRERVVSRERECLDCGRREREVRL